VCFVCCNKTKNGILQFCYKAAPSWATTVSGQLRLASPPQKHNTTSPAFFLELSKRHIFGSCFDYSFGKAANLIIFHCSASARHSGNLIVSFASFLLFATGSHVNNWRGCSTKSGWRDGNSTITSFGRHPSGWACVGSVWQDLKLVCGNSFGSVHRPGRQCRRPYLMSRMRSRVGWREIVEKKGFKIKDSGGPCLVF